MTKAIALMGMAFALAVTIVSTAYAGGKGIEAHNPWARPSIGDRPGAVYFRLDNKSSQGAVLTGASTPVAKKAELHLMSMEGGVMKMRRVEKLDIPADSRVELAPGGYHIMLFGLDKPLKKGAKFPLTLTFEGAEPVEFTVKVKNKGDDDDDDNDDDKKKRDPLSGKKFKDLTPSPD